MPIVLALPEPSVAVPSMGAFVALDRRVRDLERRIASLELPADQAGAR